jgi:hypothetical protein
MRRTPRRGGDPPTSPGRGGRTPYRAPGELDSAISRLRERKSFDAADDRAAVGPRVTWRIHTGPFPFIVPDHNGELWLWRITDGRHFTSVTVNISSKVRLAARESLSPEVKAAVDTRGKSALEACLRWNEPPREISLGLPSLPPTYWGGERDRVTS